MKTNSPKLAEWQQVVNRQVWQRLGPLTSKANGSLVELAEMSCDSCLAKI